MEAWQRRELVKEWNQRKLAHVAAMWANTNMDNPDNKREDRIREIETSYERIKADLMVTKKEREQVDDDFESSAFMRASRRSIARSLETVDQGPQLPGETSIHRLPE